MGENMSKDAKITQPIGDLYTDISLWFLSDNIKYDNERMKRLFRGCIKRVRKELDKNTK